MVGHLTLIGIRWYCGNLAHDAACCQSMFAHASSLAHKSHGMMAVQEKRVLVRFGERSHPLTFSSTASESESDEDLLKREIRKKFGNMLAGDDFFLQVKDGREVGRRVCNVAPSARIADKSVLKLVKRDMVS